MLLVFTRGPPGTGTVLAGYLANPKVGYRISVRIFGFDFYIFVKISNF
jgi:hypothetical protein